jgi:hypothetical protein
LNCRAHRGRGLRRTEERQEGEKAGEQLAHDWKLYATHDSRKEGLCVAGLQ